MLSSNLNLNIVKTVGYNNRILISNLGIIVGLNSDKNKTVAYHKKIACDTTRTQQGNSVSPKMVKSTDKLIALQLSMSRPYYLQIT